MVYKLKEVNKEATSHKKCVLQWNTAVDPCLSPFIILVCFNTATCKMVQLLTGAAPGVTALTHRWLPTLTGMIHALVHIYVTYQLTDP